MPEDVLSKPLAVGSSSAMPAEALQPVSRRSFSMLRRLRSNRLVVIGSTLTVLIVLATLMANLLAPYDPIALNARHRLEGPSTECRFGADRLGCVFLSRVLYGA